MTEKSQTLQPQCPGRVLQRAVEFAVCCEALRMSVTSIFVLQSRFSPLSGFNLLNAFLLKNSYFSFCDECIKFTENYCEHFFNAALLESNFYIKIGQIPPPPHTHTLIHCVPHQITITLSEITHYIMEEHNTELLYILWH